MIALLFAMKISQRVFNIEIYIYIYIKILFDSGVEMIRKH